MDSSQPVTPQVNQPSSPIILEESSLSPTSQALQEAKRAFPLRPLLVLLVAITPIFLGVGMVMRMVSTVQTRTAHQQALIDHTGDEDLITSSGQEEATTYTNPIDESSQYDNPFTVSAYSNPFDQ